METRDVLRRAIAARAALAELKQAAGLVPNQAMLIASLPLLEARASSEIENVVTTADELFRSLPTGSATDPATREALRYREAVLEGYRSLASLPLGTRTAEAIATRIKGVETRVRRHGGTVLRNDHTGATIYTPPSGEAVLRELLADWERFMHADDGLDPLIRMAVGHYQFEAIHPFADGNGRTGRILNILFLVERGLLGAPILYLSRHVIAHKTTYYERLLGVTAEGAWEPWTLFMLEAVEATATWTLAKIGAIRDLLGHTTDVRAARASEGGRSRSPVARVRATVLPHRRRRGARHRSAPNGLEASARTRRDRCARDPTLGTTDAVRASEALAAPHAREQRLRSVP